MAAPRARTKSGSAGDAHRRLEAKVRAWPPGRALVGNALFRLFLLHAGLSAQLCSLDGIHRFLRGVRPSLFSRRGAYRTSVDCCVCVVLSYRPSLFFDWFRAKGERSWAAQDGLNNKSRVVSSQTYGFRNECAVKGAGQQRVKFPPGNWFVPPGSNRSSHGGNEAAGASGVEGRLGDLASMP
jgi:hypothetical protein